MTERYEEVRRKLVERGYLQGRIERFLLRDLAAPGGAARTVLRASAKAALLGAPLLGGLVAASTVAANRPLLGPRDAAVLWIYFAALAATVLFGLDAGAGALAVAWARRRGARPSDALRAGLLVAAPLLLYLVILQARGRPQAPLGLTLLLLAGALAAGALVAWLAGLVSLAGIVGRTGEVPDRNRRPVALVLLVLVPIALAFFVVPAAAPSAGAIPPSPVGAVRVERRALVVCVDGLDGALVPALTPGGATANLLATFSRGALFPKHREPGLEPAEVWTTITTGMRVEDHGIRGAGATRLPGVATPLAMHASTGAVAALRFLLPIRTVPATGAGRRMRALWEIAGLVAPSSSVNFWASWPARGIAGDAEAGYLVSDRVLPKLLTDGREDRDIRPEGLFTRLKSDFAGKRPAMRREFDLRFAGLPEKTAAIAWESFLIDAFAWQAAQLLLEDGSVRASFVYLPGLDILRGRMAVGGTTGEASGLVEAQAIEAYVGWLDRAIFAGLAERAREWAIVVVADPGRRATRETEGFVAVASAGVSPACVGPAIGDLDIAPLVLRVLGLPASLEMAGRAPARCFESAPPPPPPIETWGRRGAAAGASTSDYDPEMVERLKSLGYLR
jgi:hypothetical protein